MEQRFYLVDNKTIQCLDKKYTPKSNASDNPMPENIPKNCSVAELKRSFDMLMKNKEKR